MLKPYADRVNATFQLMLATLEVMDRDGERLGKARTDGKLNVAGATSFGFNYRLDSTQVEQLPWKGYRAGYKPSAVSGLPRLYYDRSRPTDTVVAWMDRFVPKFTIDKPKAYFIPQAWREVIDRLKLDGVPLEVINERMDMAVELQRIVAYNTVTTPYEGCYLHYNVTAETEQGRVEARPGDVLVPMGHATDRLVMEILEPRASDSFFAWGFFDSVLQQKEYFSSYVFEDIAAELLTQDPALREALEQRKAVDHAFAEDADAQLYFIYQRSQHYEPGHKLYPVGRLR